MMSIAPDMNGGRHLNSGGSSVVRKVELPDHGPAAPSCAARTRQVYCVAYSSCRDCLHVGLPMTPDVSLKPPGPVSSNSYCKAADSANVGVAAPAANVIPEMTISLSVTP